ncbi:hypothetical protein EYF80_030885 [Liparis tanakae]|uniref:Uncharacterized protein n=1 Tax=Liparis tanakae TaxID=230148 RepID=A0A4Z2H0K3_9TELE|nr:hypothetical protein EYF80_030885 [Liparis tanakae]
MAAKIKFRLATTKTERGSGCRLQSRGGSEASQTVGTGGPDDWRTPGCGLDIMFEKHQYNVGQKELANKFIQLKMMHQTPQEVETGSSSLLLEIVCVHTERLFLSQQVRGDVPRLGLCGLPVMVVLRRAAAPLVLPPEAPQLGAPVFPPLEGQSGAVRHQPALLGAPAPLPLLRADQEEGAAHVEGGTAAAEVAVRDPERPEAPANITK